MNGNPMTHVDPTGHFGKHRDDKSDYWNRRNRQKVKQLEAKWERERAEKGLKELLRGTRKEFALDPMLGLAGGFGGGRLMSRLHTGDCPPLCKLAEAVDPFHLIAAGGMLFAASIGAGIGAAVGAFPEGLIVAPIFLTTAAIGLDVALYGVQKFLYQGTDKEPDPLVLVHIFFPDFGR